MQQASSRFGVALTSSLQGIVELIPFIIILMFSSCAPQHLLFEKMQREAGYSNFQRLNWSIYKRCKCPIEVERQEFLALDIEGSQVVVVTCCSMFSCDATVIK
jgi:hypothetical protein